MVDLGEVEKGDKIICSTHMWKQYSLGVLTGSIFSASYRIERQEKSETQQVVAQKSQAPKLNKGIDWGEEMHTCSMHTDEKDLL